MNKEQTERVIEALVNFVVRVTEEKTTSETEIAVLPEVVKTLLMFQ